MSRQFHRRQSVTVDGVTAQVEVWGSTNHTRRYSVTVSQPNLAFRPAVYGDVVLVNPDQPMKQAVSFARRVVAEAQRAATLPQQYVRVDGLPGYAQNDLDDRGLVQAAYWMNHETGVPTAVYRVVEPWRVQRFVEQVEGKDFYEPGSRRGRKPATVTVTDDVLAAVEDYWHACDGVTWLDARAASKSKVG